MGEDRPLELPQLRAGLDPEFAVEQAAGLPIHLERVGLSTGAVERPHQQLAGPLAQRLVDDQRLQLPDELASAANLESGGEALLPRFQVKVAQASPLTLRPVALDARQRLAAPQGQCLHGAAIAKQPFEAKRIDLLGRNGERVAAAATPDELAADEPDGGSPCAPGSSAPPTPG